MEPTQDITALQGYAGTYSKDLVSQLLNGLDIANQVKVIRNVKAPLHLTKLVVNGGIRPLDTAVNKADKPGRKWSKRTLTPKVGMKIFEVIPEELRDTWFSEMLDPNAKDVPYAQWVWEQEFAKVAQEINDNIYLSEDHSDADDYDAAAPYAIDDVMVFGELRHIYKALAVTAAGESPVTHPAKWEKITSSAIVDGPGTIIAKAILSGDLAASNIIATNVITNVNAVAELQKVRKGAPKALRNKKGIMWISDNVFEDYKADYDTRYGKGNSINDDTEDRDLVYLKGSSKKVELRPCTWMGDSQRVIYTVYDNFLMGTDQLSATNGISKIVENLHGFDAICKFILCFNFADMELLYVNDKA